MKSTWLALLFLGVVACSGETLTTSSTLVTASGGGSALSADGRVTLTFPPGAVAADTTITITPLADAELRGFEDGTLYEFGPDGTQFAQPVTITFAYDGSNASLQVAKVLHGGVGKFADASVVDTGAHAVTAQIHSFSQWGLTSCAQYLCGSAEVQPDRTVKLHFTSIDAWAVERAEKQCVNGETVDHCLNNPDTVPFGTIFTWDPTCQCPPGHSCLCTYGTSYTYTDGPVGPEAALYFYRASGDTSGGLRVVLFGDGQPQPTTCQHFDVALSPASQTTGFNVLGTTTITVTRKNGFTGALELVSQNNGVEPSGSLPTLAPGQTTATFSYYPYRHGSLSIPITAQTPGGAEACVATLTVTVP